MGIDNSSWHIRNVDLTKMRILTLFKIATRILTSKHPKLISTSLVKEMERFENFAFQNFKMQKMNIS